MCIGIADDELHALDALAIHVVDGIAAAAADTDYFDDGGLVTKQIEFHMVCLLRSLMYYI